MKPIQHAEGKGLSPSLRWLFAGIYLVFWALGIGIVALYFAARMFGFELLRSYLQSPLILLMNLLPGLLLALLLLALTNRVWPAVLGSGVVIIAGGIAQFFKLQTRSEPLVADDLRYLSEAANISSRYDLRFNTTMLLCAAAVVAATVAALLLLKARFRRRRTQLGFLALVLCACVGCYFGLYRNEAIYEQTENLIEVYSKALTTTAYMMNEWNDRDQFCGRGFWYPFLYSIGDLGADRPKEYSAAKAEALLARHSDEDIPAERKVNVIAVMLEAYADFSVFPQLEFLDDPYETFHALQQEGISGWLDCNIFAGGTIDTERCFMTGSPEMYNYRHSADSFVRYLSAQDYRTEFCHPGYNWFYNRENVAEYLGFDRSYFGESYFPIVGDQGILLDENFFPMLLELYRASAAEDVPYFNMSVTYQNHGPYAADYYYDPDCLTVRADVSEAGDYILNNYFWGIARTDKALRAFTDELRGDPEPVVLVLFGDHKPWLGDNSSIYAELGIDLRYWDAVSQLEYCRTPYLIWANDAAKAALGSEVRGEGGEFSPCYLMLKLFDACGWTGDAYMQALREAYPQADMISPKLKHYRSNGRLTGYFDHLPETVQETIEDLRIMSYYRMKDAMR